MKQQAACLSAHDPSPSTAPGCAPPPAIWPHCHHHTSLHTQVAFINGDRLVGEEAASLVTRYPDRVYAGLKDMLGRPHDDEHLRRVLAEKYLQYRLAPSQNSTSVAVETDTGAVYSAEELVVGGQGRAGTVPMPVWGLVCGARVPRAMRWWKGGWGAGAAMCGHAAGSTVPRGLGGMAQKASSVTWRHGLVVKRGVACTRQSAEPAGPHAPHTPQEIPPPHSRPGRPACWSMLSSWRRRRQMVCPPLIASSLCLPTSRPPSARRCWTAPSWRVGCGRGS